MNLAYKLHISGDKLLISMLILIKFLKKGGVKQRRGYE